MKKIIPLSLLSLVFILILNSGAKAQDALQQQKVRFFNERLQLTPAESKNFWPVYNDYQNRRDKVTADRNNLLQYFQANSANMSANEATDAINRYLLFQQQETTLLESYTKRFREFLPEKKVMQIFIVELEYKRWLLENLRDNRTLTAPRN